MLRFVAFLFLVFLVAIPAGTYYYRVPLFEKVLSDSFNTPVQIQEVDVGWNELTVKELRIPEVRFSVKRISFEMPLIAFWQDKVTIKSLTLEEPYLIPFLPKFDKSNPSAKHFTVEKVIVLNLHLPCKKVPYLEWHAVGKEAPLTLDALFSDLISRITSHGKAPKESKMVFSWEKLSELLYTKKGQVA